jgi:branched-chain amino acid transport system substrate-binding protein
LPILNRAPGGPLALVSPASSQVGLTHLDPNAPQGALARLYPTGVRNFARITPADDAEAAAGAELARQLGVRRVFVLDDGMRPSRDEWGLPFARSARALGLRVAGAASWDARGTGLPALAERVQRARADGVYLAGLPGSHGPELVAALRARLGAAMPLIAPNPFYVISFVYGGSHGAARGMYITNTFLPAARLGPRGRDFTRAFAATQPGAPVLDGSVYAAAATEVLLAAIARSDGTRAGVTRALAATQVPDGVLGPFGFDRNGDPASPRIVVLRVTRPRDNKGTPFQGAVIDRVIVPPALN